MKSGDNFTVVRGAEHTEILNFWLELVWKPFWKAWWKGREWIKTTQILTVAVDEKGHHYWDCDRPGWIPHTKLDVDSRNFSVGTTIAVQRELGTVDPMEKPFHGGGE